MALSNLDETQLYRSHRSNQKCQGTQLVVPEIPAYIDRDEHKQYVEVQVDTAYRSVCK